MNRLRPTILGNDSVTADAFGSSVAMNQDGSILVSGAPSQAGKGAVYVYALGGDFIQTQIVKLTAADGMSGDLFGNSVAISEDGNVIAVGAPGVTVYGQANFGAVYIFRRTSPTSYVQEAKLVTTLMSGSPLAAQFGYRIAMSGDGKVLAAANHSSNPAAQYALAFHYESGAWAEKILPFTLPTEVGNTQQNWSVAVDYSGEFIFATQPESQESCVRIFRNDAISNPNYVLFQTLANNIINANSYGASIAVSNDGQTLLVGAPKTSDVYTEIGIVCVYRRARRDEPFPDSPTSIINPPNEDLVNNLHFGAQLACDSLADNVLVGSGLIGTSQKVYHVNRNGALSGYNFYLLDWDHLGSFQSPTVQPAQNFGQSLAISKDAFFYAIGANNLDTKGGVWFWKAQFRLYQHGFLRLADLNTLYPEQYLEYSLDNADSYVSLNNSTQYTLSQKFVVASDTAFDSVALRLNKVGTPTGFIAIRVVKQAGIYPSTVEDELLGQSEISVSDDLVLGDNDINIAFPTRLKAGTYFLQLVPFGTYYSSWVANTNEVKVAADSSAPAAPNVLAYNNSTQSFSEIANTAFCYSLVLSSEILRGRFDFLNFSAKGTSNPNVVVSKPAPFNYSGGEFMSFDVDGNLINFTMPTPAIQGSGTATEVASFLTTILAAVGGKAQVISGNRVEVSSTLTNGYVRFFPKWNFSNINKDGTSPAMDIFQWEKGFAMYGWRPDVLSRARVSAALSPATSTVRKSDSVSELYANASIRNFLDEVTLTSSPQSVSVDLYYKPTWGWTKKDLIQFAVENFLNQPTQKLTVNNGVTVYSTNDPDRTSHVNIVLFEGLVPYGGIFNLDYFGAFWFL